MNRVEPSMQSARRSHPILGALVVALLSVAAVIALSGTWPDIQTFVGLSVLILGVGVLWARGAARREPALRPRFLVAALCLHVVGSVLRYVIILAIYHGVSDADGYMASGQLLVPAFRSFHWPPFPAPGTPFMNWITGLLFAFTGVSMLAGFVACATASFVGAWYFYKAFSISFPEGNKRLYAYLIFLLPSMWYWPSSLGKDAIVMLFLGMGTYGFAMIFRGHLPRGLAFAIAGVAGVTAVRPPVAAVLVLAALIAVAVRPWKTGSPQVRALVWLLMIPLLVGLVIFTVKSTGTFLNNKGFVEAYQAQREADFGSGGSASNFAAPNLFSLSGPPAAIVTSNFRPFPWEAGGGLGLISSMEGLFLVGLLVVKWREVGRGLAGWRQNGMVILVALTFVGMSMVLSSLANFGLLARQRTQVLPYLLMLPAIVNRARVGRKRGALSDSNR